MRIIAVANQKGGCGKTTTAINLSACLAFLRKNVLLVDFDPQGHSTCGFGIKAEFLDRTAYDLFSEHLRSTTDLIVPVNDYLSLIPSHVVLSRAEQEWAHQSDAQERLALRVGEIQATYDFVVIDTPPNLGLLTYNALFAADEVIVPIEPSFFALHGLVKIFETIDSLRVARGKKLRIHALLTRCEKRTRLGREIKEEVRKYFKDQVFVNTIDENIRLREAAADGKSIVDFDRQSSGFRNYMGLAIEVIERGLIWHEVDPSSQGGAGASSNLDTSIAEESPVGGNNALSSGGENSSAPASVNGTNSNGVYDSEKHSNGYISSLALEIQNKLLDPESCEINLLFPKRVLGGILFSYVDPKAVTVFIAGDFNRWVVEPLTLIDKECGYWQKIIPLDAGVHRYKYIVDDEWRIDPSNQAMESNPYGGFDSVIIVESQAGEDQIRGHVAGAGVS